MIQKLRDKRDLLITVLGVSRDVGYNDEYWMRAALQEARAALNEDEVPIGAVLIKDNMIIAANHNRTKQNNDPTAHAEKLAIASVIQNNNIYLYDFTLYTTLEPCVMCAGTILLSRIGRVVYATADKKAGAVGSVYNILSDSQLNHRPEITVGVLQEEASLLLTRFFKEKRK